MKKYCAWWEELVPTRKTLFSLPYKQPELLVYLSWKFFAVSNIFSSSNEAILDFGLGVGYLNLNFKCITMLLSTRW